MHLPRLLIVCLAASTVLSGCGRRGGLQLPPDASATPNAESQNRASALPGTLQTQSQKPPVRDKSVPDKPFILDGLI